MPETASKASSPDAQDSSALSCYVPYRPYCGADNLTGEVHPLVRATIRVKAGDSSIAPVTCNHILSIGRIRMESDA